MKGQRLTVTGQRRAHQIRSLADQGMTSRQVATEVGICQTRVIAIAKRYGIPLARSNSRRFSAYHSIRRAEVIAALAKESQVSPASVIDYAVRLLVDDGIDAARKKLGKLAVPRKSYNKTAALP